MGCQQYQVEVLTLKKLDCFYLDQFEYPESKACHKKVSTGIQLAWLAVQLTVPIIKITTIIIAQQFDMLIVLTPVAHSSDCTGAGVVSCRTGEIPRKS